MNTFLYIMGWIFLGVIATCHVIALIVFAVWLNDLDKQLKNQNRILISHKNEIDAGNKTLHSILHKNDHKWRERLHKIELATGIASTEEMER